MLWLVKRWRTRIFHWTPQTTNKPEQKVQYFYERYLVRYMERFKLAWEVNKILYVFSEQNVLRYSAKLCLGRSTKIIQCRIVYLPVFPLKTQMLSMEN
jgi:hypothetical protein